jgi:hypothetical protein
MQCAGLPEGILPKAVTEPERIAHCAGFARELSDAAWRTPDLQREWVLSRLTERFHATVPRASKHLPAVIRHSLDVGRKYCCALGVDATSSALIDGFAKWGESRNAPTVATSRLDHPHGHKAHEVPDEEPLGGMQKSAVSSSIAALIACVKRLRST